MQVTDPVCGMTFDNTKATATEIRQGQTFYFCSQSCRDKFRAAPDRYIKSAVESGKSHGSHCC